MSWTVAVVVLLGCAAAGALIGLVRSRGIRRLLLGLAAVAAMAVFVPVTCATAEAGVDTLDPGQFGGQTSCTTFYGWRLPEAAAFDGDAGGYALALAGAAITLGAGGAVAARRRRVPA